MIQDFITCGPVLLQVTCTLRETILHDARSNTAAGYVHFPWDSVHNIITYPLIDETVLLPALDGDVIMTSFSITVAALVDCSTDYVEVLPAGNSSSKPLLRLCVPAQTDVVHVFHINVTIRVKVRQMKHVGLRMTFSFHEVRGTVWSR